VRIVARHIRDGLALADPAGRAAYEANCAAFVGELEDLHRRMEAILAPVRGRTFLVFHPAFGYLADAYGLAQVAVEAEGKEPSARQLARLIERAREERVRAIFLQPQFSPKSAEKVAEAVGASVVVLDDLARDYPANMERMARAIAEGLSR
jgi:zinc transport system substrate-binding protein